MNAASGNSLPKWFIKGCRDYQGGAQSTALCQSVSLEEMFRNNADKVQRNETIRQRYLEYGYGGARAARWAPLLHDKRDC